MTRPVRQPVRQLGVGDATIGPLEKQLVQEVLDAGRLSSGRFTAAFEGEFARLHERRFGVFCNSGTSALQVALHALREREGWQDGDEVLVPAVTFVATANVVLQNGLRPVFVDVEPDYYAINPALLETAITPRTKAIIPVHVFGQPADMDAVTAVALRHRLRVVEDSCEAMFVRWRHRPVGAWGDLACFSTYVAHLIVTGVGGLVTTDDGELAVMIRSLINHGRDGIYLNMDADRATDPQRLFEIVNRRFSFIHQGYSYRATEMEAALGLAQLQRREEIVGAHQRNAAYLTAGLRTHEAALQLPAVRPGAEHAFMMYPIMIREGGPPREEVIRFLEEHAIETRYMLPLLNQPIYLKLFGDLEPQYPVARAINARGFYIGCHQGLSRDDLDYIVDTFARFFRRA
jgi:perosamine synthetase